MIATEQACLTAEQLRDVATGRLPADRFGRLMEHLDACVDCQRRAEAVEASEDSLAAALAAPPAVDPLTAEPDCIAALHACSREPGSVAQPSATPVEQLGPYRLIRPLGSGAMGAVFLAHHTRLRRQCAIKLLPRTRGFDAAWRDRFDREMAAVAALDDPHVVSASDAGEADGWHYLVMEYLDGLDLSRLVSRLGPLPVADACELVRQAAVGLAHIHAAGLVHRDVKPSNLMLTRDGVVKILDLGLVLSGADPLPADDRLTTVGQLMGTLAYMAPEQLIDSMAVDHRADLYALGATLYRLLAGTPPHGTARGLAPLVVAKTGRTAAPISDHRNDLPAPLVALVANLLDRDPAQRPQSAMVVAAGLQPFINDARPDRLVAAALRTAPSAGEPAISAALLPNGVPTAAVPPRRRSWGKWLAAAAALPLLVLAGILITIVTDRGQLVIESDVEGLAVRVEQGDELVEQLRLSLGENTVTLRSGTYTVTLDAAADGLQLSDNTATVTRGDETVLRVRQDAAASAASTRKAGEAGPLYRGEPLQHWLAVLENERDVETVIDAMKAVVALASDDTGGDRSDASTRGAAEEAAAALLRAARRYGGMVAGGTDQEAPSLRFMDSLLSLYSALLPEPGLQAISRELVSGTPESSMAVIWLLRNYANESSHSEAYRPSFGELQRWSETVEGRHKLQELASNVDTAVERLGGYGLRNRDGASRGSDAYNRASAVGSAYLVRLQIDELLGVNAFEDPAIADRLRNSIEEAAEYYRTAASSAGGNMRKMLLSEEELRAISDVDAAMRHVAADTLAWAATPVLNNLSFSDPAFRLTLHRRLADAAPAATADAALAVLIGNGGLRVEHEDSAGVPSIAIRYGRGAFPWEDLLPQAIELIGRATTRPQQALALINPLLNEIDRLQSATAAEPSTELLKALQTASEQLESRVGTDASPRDAATGEPAASPFGPAGSEPPSGGFF